MHLKPIFKVELKLARLDATVAAGTVSDLWILFGAGGLPSKVADLCTLERNRTGSSEIGNVLDSVVDVFTSGTGVNCSSGCSKAPSGSFSVTSVLGDVLKRELYKYLAPTGWSSKGTEWLYLENPTCYRFVEKFFWLKAYQRNLLK